MIVASLATLPSRVGLLQQTIRSLRDQVDAICVYLNGHDTPPAFLRDPKVVHAVLSREAGWRGAEGKLWFWDPNEFRASPRWSDDVVALVCDDDIVYPPDYAERMAAAVERHRGAVVCVHGSILVEPLQSYSVSRLVAPCNGPLERDARVHVPGTGSMAFRVGDVPIDVGSFVWSHAVDPQMALHCRRRGIDVWAVARPENWLRPMRVPDKGTSIFRERVGRGNDGVETALLRSASPWPELEMRVPGLAPRTSLVLSRPRAGVIRRGPLDLGTPNPNAMLCPEALDWLRPRLATLGADQVVVELGSGHGTANLVELAPGRLISVEHDERFVGLVEGTRYVHADLVDGWYDPIVLEHELPAPARLGAVIVDGPPHRGRSLILGHLEHFGDAPLLIDDVHRSEELELAREIAVRRRRPLSVHTTLDGRAFATLGWSVP